MFAVVTRMAVTAAGRAKALELVAASAPIFARQRGFEGQRTFLSEDGESVVSVFEWATKADHEACMMSPDFAALNAGWGELLQSGAASFEMWTGAPVAPS